MTVGFQSFQEAEWVWGDRSGARATPGFLESRVRPFLQGAAGRARIWGTSCPRSSPRKQIQASLAPLELSVCPGSREVFRGAEALVGPPPPLLAVLQDAELSFGRTVGGGAEGSVSPPSPSSGFRLETVCAASKRPPPPLAPPSRPHPLGRALLGRSRARPPAALRGSLEGEGRPGRRQRRPPQGPYAGRNDRDVLFGIALLERVGGLQEPAESTPRGEERGQRPMIRHLAVYKSSTVRNPLSI